MSCVSRFFLFFNTIPYRDPATRESGRTQSNFRKCTDDSEKSGKNKTGIKISWKDGPSRACLVMRALFYYYWRHFLTAATTSFQQLLLVATARSQRIFNIGDNFHTAAFFLHPPFFLEVDVFCMKIWCVLGHFVF